MAERVASLVNILIQAQNQTAAAFAQVTATLDKLEQQGGKTTKSFDRMANSFSPARVLTMAGGFIVVGGAVRALEWAIEGVQDGIIGFNARMEQAQISMTVMSGSAELATQHLAELKQFAIATPFRMEELVEASKRVQAYGVEVEQVIPTLTILGNIAAGVGTDKLPQLILAFGQVKAAAHLTGMELRQFSEAGVPLLGMLAVQMGVTTGKMVEMISAGQVSFDDVRRALQTLSETKFGGLMAAQSRTFQGSLSNLADASQQFIATAGTPFFETVAKMTQSLADSTIEATKAQGKEESLAEAVKGRILVIGLAYDMQGRMIDRVRSGVQAIKDETRSVTENSLEQERLSISIRSMLPVYADMESRLVTAASLQRNFTAELKRTIEMAGRIGETIEALNFNFPYPGPIPDFAGALGGAENIRGLMDQAEKLAKSGAARDAMEILITIGKGLEESANLVSGWMHEAGPAAEKVHDKIAEMLPVMTQLEQHNAFGVWREEMKKLLESGLLEDVIAQFEAIGKTADETADQIIAMAKELTEATKQMIEQQADAIKNTLAKGGTLDEAFAAFAKTEWITSMMTELKKALAAGLTPSGDLIQSLRDALAEGNASIPVIAASHAALVSAFPSYQGGGMVPGPSNRAQMSVLHGGEMVIPNGEHVEGLLSEILSSMRTGSEIILEVDGQRLATTLGRYTVAAGTRQWRMGAY